MSQAFDFNQKPSATQDIQQALLQAQEECARLREEIAQLTEERDDYLKALYALTRKEVSFTEEEIIELEKTGGPLEPILEELEREAGYK